MLFKRKMLWVLPLLALVLAACAPQEVEVTRIVEVEVPIETEVEVPVETEVEVTRLVEVEVPVETEVEVTRIVEVEVPAEAEAEAEEEEAADEGPAPFEPPTAVIASGLLSPRQMHYTADGTLYISEAGLAGDSLLVIDPETSADTGLTSQITAVAPDGTQTIVLPSLPSANTGAGSTAYRGAQAIYVTDDTYWVGIGEGPQARVGLTYFRNIVGIDRENTRIHTIIDAAAGAIEAGQPDPNAINSDPTDITMTADGTLLIADAGCNCLWSWTEEAGRQLIVTWPIDDNPVPTGVAVGPDGDIYVSFLSGFPFDVGSARIERWSGGELVQTYGDLTLVTDVLVTDDSTIYAVEMAAGLGDSGLIPDSGRVITVSEEGVTPVLENLRIPYGLAQAPDGSLVVSVNAAFDGEGNGLVIAVEGSQ
ncbi:MAG: ScyD/ScyE family protein [Chloroflexota bacterium]